MPRRLDARAAQGGPRQGVAPHTADLLVLLALLLVATALRSFAQHAVNTFVPKFQQDLGVSPNVYGVLMSLNLLPPRWAAWRAYLADRVGLRRILVITLILAGLPPRVHARERSLVGYAAFVLAGLFYGPSHTLLVVSGQRQFPIRWP